MGSQILTGSFLEEKIEVCSDNLWLVVNTPGET